MVTLCLLFLFCIAEDVLNRCLSKLESNNKIKLIKAYRSMMVPSHTLYADEIMLFTKGNIFSLDAIMNLLKQYAYFPYQVCNPSKTIMYA